MSKLILQKDFSASDGDFDGNFEGDLEGGFESKELAKPKETAILKEFLISHTEEPIEDSKEGLKETFVFGLAEGPFLEYKRKIEKFKKNDLYISEKYEFKLAVPVWKVLLIPLIKRSFRADSVLSTSASTSSISPISSAAKSSKKTARAPFWAPGVRIDGKSAHTLSILCLLSVIGGYLGTLLSQTITFVGDDFGAGTQTQGYMLAVIRVGVVFAFLLAASADKYGRRKLVRITVLAGCVFTVLTATSFDIFSYSAFQTLARALGTGFALLIGIMAAEETPAGARAYAVSVLSLSAALGAGGVVWLLPLADLGDSAWRILYLVPLLALLGLVPLLKALPETRRFKQAEADAKATDGARNSPHSRIYKARLALLGAAAFFLSIFLTPASQLQNEFLRDERGFSGARLSLFQLTTNTPGGIGVFLGGKLADLRGRRLVGAIGLAGGTLFIISRYLFGGWQMWISGGLASIFIAAIVPALGVYSPELFSTSRRGRFGGGLAIIGVGGSALGLVLVSWLAESLDSFGSAFALVAIAPLIVILLILIKFPETANLELEDLNPDDNP